jgi:hypothetical protein
MGLVTGEIESNQPYPSESKHDLKSRLPRGHFIYYAGDKSAVISGSERPRHEPHANSDTGRRLLWRREKLG